jgi:hypothetical protein
MVLIHSDNDKIFVQFNHVSVPVHALLVVIVASNILFINGLLEKITLKGIASLGCVNNCVFVFSLFP